MPGVQAHLDCSCADTRRIGMVVSEAVTAWGAKPDQETLKFEVIDSYKGLMVHKGIKGFLLLLLCTSKFKCYFSMKTTRIH